MKVPLAIETIAMVFLEDKNKLKSKLDEHSPTFAVDSSMEEMHDDGSTELLSCSLVDTECSVSIASSSDFRKSLLQDEDEESSSHLASPLTSFTSLRLNYLMVNLVIMLADGLQGTHLYVLYDGYGFNVASLYALGFMAGAVTTPITGPLIDKFGRKRSAVLYCVLEMGINLLEQYPFLAGLLVSRIVGGITTNLLSSVFETWLDTEFRNHRHTERCSIDTDTTITFETNKDWNAKDDEDKIVKNEYEIIMRDSVIVSNLASIASGYLAHVLAERYGPVGPFQGAVTCTGIALVVISLLWTENYGESSSTSSSGEGEEGPKTEIDEDCDEDHKIHTPVKNDHRSSKSVKDYIVQAISIFRSDPKVLYLGLIQGLSAGSLQIFIFLWSPTLQTFTSGDKICREANYNGGIFSLSSLFAWATDQSGDPAYGLIFGAFMAAGVTGGLCAPYIRQAVGILFQGKDGSPSETFEVGGISVRPMELEFLVGMNYMFAAGLMLIPSLLPKSSPESFSFALAAFLTYEFLVGVTMTCEGVIRSIYLPSDGRATMMMVPRMVVNLAVSLGVLLTKYIETQSAFLAIAFLMTCSSFLQLSFMSRREWAMIRRQSIHHMRRMSSSAGNILWPSTFDEGQSGKLKSE